MGLLITQGLLHHPLDQIIAIDVVQNRLDLAKATRRGRSLQHGSEIDTTELAADLKAREIDVVVDTSGHQGGLDLSTDIVKRGGRINLFGWLKGDTATFDPTKWHMGGFTVVNSSPSSKIRDTFEAAIRMIHRGCIRSQTVGHTHSDAGGIPRPDAAARSRRPNLYQGRYHTRIVCA